MEAGDRAKAFIALASAAAMTRRGPVVDVAFRGSASGIARDPPLCAMTNARVIRVTYKVPQSAPRQSP
jgi:hypothetical protein